MKGGTVIRNARLRAGLSQAELARRLGTQQPVIARWERGSRSPDFDTVVRAVTACGLDLSVTLTEPDAGERRAVSEFLSLTPAARLKRNRRMLLLERRLQASRQIQDA